MDAIWEGGAGFGENDYAHLALKPDHANRPLWICSDGRIFLESFSPVYKAAYDFLISVAEPVCRPANMHEKYVLTPHSLYAAVSVGLETSTILGVLGRLSKTELSPEIHEFVRACTANTEKVKLVLQRNRFFLESPDPNILKELLADDVVRRARVAPPAGSLPGADGGGPLLPPRCATKPPPPSPARRRNSRSRRTPRTPKAPTGPTPPRGGRK